MHQGRLLLLALFLLPLIGWGIYQWRSDKPIYYQSGTQKYKVVRWEVHRGTNLTFASDYPIKQWARRQLDKIGIRLKGSRSDSPFHSRGLSDNPHVIKLLCEADASSLQPASRIDLLRDAGGRKVVRGQLTGPPGHIWFFWAYDASLQPELVLSTHPNPHPTNPASSQFRIVSKPDNQELLAWPVVD